MVAPLATERRCAHGYEMEDLRTGASVCEPCGVPEVRSSKTVNATIAVMRSMLNRKPPQYCNEIRLPAEKAALLVEEIERLRDIEKQYNQECAAADEVLPDDSPAPASNDLPDPEHILRTVFERLAMGQEYDPECAQISVREGARLSEGIERLRARLDRYRGLPDHWIGLDGEDGEPYDPNYMRRPAHELSSPQSYQERVFAWAVECFGEDDTVDPATRTYRFLEEALELVQACGCTRETALQILEYVYGRPQGAVAQEVGGTMVSLAVLCKAFGIGMDRCGEDELTRVLGKVEHIRARHAAKPKFGSAAEKTSAALECTCREGYPRCAAVVHRDSLKTDVLAKGVATVRAAQLDVAAKNFDSRDMHSLGEACRDSARLLREFMGVAAENGNGDT